jgi:hypothetical protein
MPWSMLGILWKHSFLAFESGNFDFEHHLETRMNLLFEGLASHKDVI